MDHDHATRLTCVSFPFRGDQVVVQRARARIVDEIVHDPAACTTLEQGIAFLVLCVEVSDDQDVRDVVVNERALRMLASEPYSA